jgi:hypothetical protein
MFDGFMRYLSLTSILPIKPVPYCKYARPSALLPSLAGGCKHPVVDERWDTREEPSTWVPRYLGTSPATSTATSGGRAIFSETRLLEISKGFQTILQGAYQPESSWRPPMASNQSSGGISVRIMSTLLPSTVH